MNTDALLYAHASYARQILSLGNSVATLHEVIAEIFKTVPGVDVATKLWAVKGIGPNYDIVVFAPRSKKFLLIRLHANQTIQVWQASVRQYAYVSAENIISDRGFPENFNYQTIVDKGKKHPISMLIERLPDLINFLSKEEHVPIEK